MRTPTADGILPPAPTLDGEETALHTPARDDTGDPDAARRAARAAFLGGTLEYYDFGIFLTASSLVFNKIMFAGDATSATLASLMTFGLAYVARPLGAIVLGNLGDRFGRKRILVVTLLLMGGSTFLIGCLPTYAAAGLAAPVLLIALRLVQGVSAGGEIAGSSVLVVEHAPAHRRGFYGSWAINGPIAGFVLSSVVFVGVAAMPEDVLLSWGWRVPFWASVLVLAVAYLVRRTIEEPEVFVREAAAPTTTPPLRQLLRQSPAMLRLAACAMFTTVNTIVSVFGLTYATQTVGLSASLMLAVSIVANVIAIPVQTLGGMLSDRIGRRPVMVIGSLGCAAGIFGYFAAITAQEPVLVFVAAIVLTGGFYSLANGVYPSFFVEMFPTRVRYTGTAIGLQISQLVAGFAPVVALALAGGAATHWLPAAVLTAGLCGLSAVAVLTARETFRTPLGSRRPEPAVS
ncbi:MFS transporter [Pseudonocardia thermophila]|uniref:MFS transporter n=1 Tax=Pseudonocardia thermophila TaxID=1848 RepID=UPI00248D4047|nr:MFS transporter [Pseudonocardia thermophila]